MSTPLEELRKEADDLGIKYGKTLGAEKLQIKINEFYEAQETSGPAVAEAVQEQEAAEQEAEVVVEEQKPKLTREQERALIRAQRKRDAEKTRVVTIVDNDQRVNNHTTMCVASCSNQFFDLGTIRIPLNERVEVKMGHINVLADVTIPQHVKDPKTGLSTVRMRPRYSITFG